MSPPTVDELLAHAPFLERLARKLVPDEHDARDLVQETWVAALERPPRHAGNPRAWLGVVMRRRAARIASRLGASSDAVGEAAAPEGEYEAATVYRRISTAVHGLDGLYRTVVLERFYEDRPPREIAARLDVPVSTVNTRLQRGLATLRARLDRDAGRRTWVGALLAHARDRDGRTVGSS